MKFYQHHSAPMTQPLPAGVAGPNSSHDDVVHDGPLAGIGPVLVVPRQRQMGLGYGGKIMGWHPVRAGHPAVAYEGTLERDQLTCLGRLDCVVKIIEQPVTIHFHYRGQRYRYTPDFWVQLRRIPAGLAALGVHANRFFIEVKSSKRLEACQQRLEIKCAALRHATGLSTVVTTEIEIRDRAEEFFHD